MKLQPVLAASLFYSASLLLSAATTVAVSPQPAAADADGVGSFVFEVLEVELAGRDGVELVDRKRLRDLLAEQSLGASGMTGENAAAIGKLVGANYYVFGETAKAGESTAIKCRVVQVETGVFQPVLIIAPNGQDPMEAGATLADRVGQAIDKLEGRAKASDAAAEEADLELAADAKLPVIAFRIPEVSVTPQGRTADPAAEKSLEAFLQKNGCKLVQLSRPSQSVAAGAGFMSGETNLGIHLESEEHEALLTEAKAKGVDVIILGVAASERASQIGNFSAARARVELAAIRVRDSHILATSSGYGVASDISAFVAEKKAIESATEKLRRDFVSEIIAAHNAAE